jgi:hypothetical protein
MNEIVSVDDPNRQIIMKQKRAVLIFSIALILAACSNNKSQNVVTTPEKIVDSLQAKSTMEQEIQKTIKLDYGFEINVGREEDFDDFQVYSLFILKHNNKPIYIDTSMMEYEFGDKLYPIIRPIGKETFEILVEVNDRPSKSYLTYIQVHQGKIVGIEKLPTFIASAANLDSDDYLEFAGFWDNGETWGENYSLTTYNPIIYYELRPNGITLDTTLTNMKDKEIYGNFLDSNNSKNVEINIRVTQKRDEEIDRISGKK